MTKRINETSPHENLIRRFESACDRVFHWIIALMLLFLVAGLLLPPSSLGVYLLILAGILFFIVLIPFVAVKMFMPEERKPQSL